MSVWETPFIVVDVETTGSNPDYNRITDIACVLVQGGEIISEFSTLINPHQFIPAFIANMTGISNEMAYRAPEAPDVLPEVAEYLAKPGAVFVAHNVKFDWSFVSATLSREGFDYPALRRLCTLKLSRRLLSKAGKKNVGALAEYFGIKVKNRHRALGDARATAGILLELLDIAESEHNITLTDDLLQFQNQPIRNFKPAPSSINKVRHRLDELPDSPGVYYFLDKSGSILYVGKAKSLKERVRSYFNNGALTSRKISQLLKKIFDIKWELTETELSALLFESKEIKRLKPPFNTVSKRLFSYPFIRLSVNDPFPVFEIAEEIINDGAEYFGPFKNIFVAHDILTRINKNFRLRKCDKPPKDASPGTSCIYNQINKCIGPCAGDSYLEDYYKEIESAKYFLSSYSDGIISQLESRMFKYSEDLEFEKAAMLKNQIYEMKKIFLRNENVPTSVKKNNLVLLIPQNTREKTLQAFIIKSGKLKHQQILGRKAPLDDIFAKIKEFYYNGSHENEDYSPATIDEIKIVGSWLYRHSGSGKFIYIEGKSEKELLQILEYEIRNFNLNDYGD